MAKDRVRRLNQGKLYLDAPDGTRKMLGTFLSAEVRSKVGLIPYTKPGDVEEKYVPGIVSSTFKISTFSGTSFFTKIFDKYTETAVMDEFAMVGIEEDPNSSTGRYSTRVDGCVAEEIVRLLIGETADPAKYDITGRCGKIQTLSEYTEFDNEF